MEVMGGGFVAMGTRTEDLYGSPENIVLLKMDESGGFDVFLIEVDSEGNARW